MIRCVRLLDNMVALFANCPVVGVRVASHQQPAGRPQATARSSQVIWEIDSSLLSLDETLPLSERLRA